MNQELETINQSSKDKTLVDQMLNDIDYDYEEAIEIDFNIDHESALKIDSAFDVKKQKQELLVEFQTQWEIYERKGNRKTSWYRFSKLSKVNIDLLKIHLPRYVKSTPDAKYRKGFESYINLECWNDEITTTGNYYEAAKNNNARPESNLARFSRKIQADIAAEDPFE
ncbi:MAG: hypothetical protein ACI9N9_001196 [Enterobacterales bacterium]|jgi:hypothetical protein